MIKRKHLLIMLMIMAIIPISDLSSMELEKKPMKAAALSFFLPAGGQFYNESYLKAGFVLALEGGLIGLTLYNHYQTEKHYDKYLETGLDMEYEKYLDYYYKRQNDLWWTGIVIFLSTIDAYVDAHLYNFEANRDKLRLKFENSYLLLSWSFE
ncbi:MAG: hypothetical protein JW996_00695 [Candidatus Cloacimonetes bacterium]|nr:hypothetical protein [Candidatus Cloacimonadota bacterium]